ncbi:hypothetical protein BaRGS_00009639 [Batillaria attramentaria]|uniref:Uncharacterized protein n=1 Tax=Batillaria attramentaria TaxID=370345 RepID=A0ABD0LJC7_9CAEN
MFKCFSGCCICICRRIKNVSSFVNYNDSQMVSTFPVKFYKTALTKYIAELMPHSRDEARRLTSCLYHENCSKHRDGVDFEVQPEHEVIKSTQTLLGWCYSARRKLWMLFVVCTQRTSIP